MNNPRDFISFLNGFLMMKDNLSKEEVVIIQGKLKEILEKKTPEYSAWNTFVSSDTLDLKKGQSFCASLHDGIYPLKTC